MRRKARPLLMTAAAMANQMGPDWDSPWVTTAMVMGTIARSAMPTPRNMRAMTRAMITEQPRVPGLRRTLRGGRRSSSRGILYGSGWAGIIGWKDTVAARGT